MSMVLCGNASDSLYLTFKGGCRKVLPIEDAYRCTGCGGRFHKDCILEHFKLEAAHDWGRQQERFTVKQQVMAFRRDMADMRGLGQIGNEGYNDAINDVIKMLEADDGGQ